MNNKDYKTTGTPLTLQVTGCNGKKGFDNKELANFVATKTNRSKGTNLNTYKCANCRKYHIGTSSRDM